MQFNLDEYKPFLGEIKAWCEARWPGGVGPSFEIGGEDGEANIALYKSMQKELGAQGWLCGGWPAAYGGGGWPVLKQAVFNEMAAYHRIPATGLANVGVSTIGPTIMIYGSDEQKAFFLPKIAGGEIFWGQGFSEPNAGSDLASLQTRAVADGDDFVINGAKIWNHSTYADYMLLLARSDPEAPKHRGISQLLIPLKGVPGVTIQPILDAYRVDRWTLTTLEDVRVPRGTLVGELNRGWYQTTTSLDFERSQMAWVGGARRALEEILAWAGKKDAAGRRPLDDQFTRDRLAELAVEVEMARWLAYRVAYLQNDGQVPNSEASISKLWSTEVQQRIQRVGATIAGPLGHLSAGSPWTVRDGSFDEEYWGAIGTTLAGGASEIQRNIIATRGLGLPR